MAELIHSGSGHEAEEAKAQMHSKAGLHSGVNAGSNRLIRPPKGPMDVYGFTNQ